MDAKRAEENDSSQGPPMSAQRSMGHSNCLKPRCPAAGMSMQGVDGDKSAPAKQLADTASVVHMAGSLERVPTGCMYLLLKILPPASRLALLATSRTLARQVLEAAPGGITLFLHEQRALRGPQWPLTIGAQTEVRRGIITRLLGVRQNFAVQLQPGPWQPFPRQLADRITAIIISDSRKLKSVLDPILACHDVTVSKPMPSWFRDAAADSCSWHAMTSLRTLAFHACHIRDNDYAQLCDAVQAGQLQQLRAFRLHGCDNLRNLDRLIRTLGQQLEDVATDDRQLIMKISQLPLLRSCSLTDCALEKDVMQQLCEHPTLRHVTLQVCDPKGDYSQLSCSWGSLTLMHPCLKDLPRLPLAGVEQIHISQAVSDRWFRCDPFVLQRVLDKHAHKLVCQGDATYAFALKCPCATMVPFVERMQGVETVILQYEPAELDVIALIWKALPASVKNVCVDSGSGLVWPQLWQGLPQQVATVTVAYCDITASDICELVRTAPLHVQTMVLKAGSHSVHAKWEATGLHAATPKHLQVELSL